MYNQGLNCVLNCKVEKLVNIDGNYVVAEYMADYVILSDDKQVLVARPKKNKAGKWELKHKITLAYSWADFTKRIKQAQEKLINGVDTICIGRHNGNWSHTDELHVSTEYLMHIYQHNLYSHKGCKLTAYMQLPNESKFDKVNWESKIKIDDDSVDF